MNTAQPAADRQDDQGAAHDPAWPPPPTPAPRRLYRDPSGPVGGVATGIAHYLSVDVWIVQAGFVLLTVVGGIGALLYAALWLALPTLRDGQIVPADRTNVVIAAAIAVVALATPGFVFGGRLKLLAIGLIVVGAILLTQSDSARPAPTSPRQPSPTPPGRPAPNAATWAQPLTQPGMPLRPLPTREQRPPAPPTGLIAVAVGAVAVGVMLALSQTTAPSITAPAIWGVFVLACGLGLLVGALQGRPRWWLLAPVGFALIGMASANVVAASDSWGVDNWSMGEWTMGESSYTVASPGDLADTYTVTAGDLDLDLTGLTLDADRTVTIKVVAASASIIVPSDMTVSLDGRIRAGQIAFFGNTESGGRINSKRTQTGTSAHTLTIIANVSAGELVIDDDN